MANFKVCKGLATLPSIAYGISLIIVEFKKNIQKNLFCNNLNFKTAIAKSFVSQIIIKTNSFIYIFNNNDKKPSFLKSIDLN